MLATPLALYLLVGRGGSTVAQDIKRRTPERQFNKRMSVRLSNASQVNSCALRSRLAASMIGRNRCSSSLRGALPACVLTFSAART